MLRISFINMRCRHHTFHFSLFKQHDQIYCQKGAHTLPSARPNFLSEGVRLGLDKEIRLDGTYLKYFPFSRMIERSRITPYHKKEKSYPKITHRVARPNFLPEWCSSGADTRNGGWDILSVCPIRQFD